MTTKLAVEKRDQSIPLSAVRAEGKVPAVVYGPKQEPIHITIEGKNFDKVRAAAGESTIVELEGLDEETDVLIKDVDFDPVSLAVLHADFYAIERGKELTVSIALEFVGEAPAEETNIGSVTKILQEIAVTCRPRDLPAHIDVDISGMDAADSKILVSDLPKLEGVTYNAEAEDPVAVISVAKEEVDEDPEEVDMDAIDTEEKGAAEGEAVEEKKED